MLTWEERATLIAFRRKRGSGFGMQLIDKGIRHNLGGETKVEFQADRPLCRAQRAARAVERAAHEAAAGRSSRSKRLFEDA